jgi:hypothetical protein
VPLRRINVSRGLVVSVETVGAAFRILALAKRDFMKRLIIAAALVAGILIGGLGSFAATAAAAPGEGLTVPALFYTEP